MFEDYILLLQLCTIITGLFCFRKKGPVLFWIIWMMTVLGFLNEHLLVDHAQAWWGIHRNVFYNSYVFIDITAWSAIFFLIFRKRKLFRYLPVLFWLLLVTRKVYEINENGSEKLVFMTLIYFCSGCILFSIVYFAGIFKKDYHDLSSDYTFWICCASLCFHSVLMVNLITIPYVDYWVDDLSANTFDILQLIGVTFYTLFICATFIRTCYRSGSRQTL